MRDYFQEKIRFTPFYNAAQHCTYIYNCIVLVFSDNMHSYSLHKLGKSINSFYDGLFPRQISFRRNSLKSFCKSSRHIMHSATSIFDAVSNLQRLYPIKWPPDEIYFCVLILWLPQYLASLKIFVNIDVENILSSTANLINSFTVYSLYTRRFAIELYLYTFCWLLWSVFI